MPFQKNLLIACLSTALIYTNAQPVFAGFEWVPSKQKAPVQAAPTNDMMVIDNAPVAPVINETLQPAAPQQNQVLVAPAPVSIDPANEAMMPLPGEIMPTVKMQTMTITPPAVEEAAEMQPQELKSTETQIDLATESSNVTNSEPAVLVPQTNTVDQNIASTPTQPYVPEESSTLTIQPFPIMKAENKAMLNDPMVQISTQQNAPQAAETTTLSAEDKTDAVGFGNDMPLALAVQQIVPPSFSYSFAQSVNAGQRVSWNGGKPWDIVLKETLEPIGMNIRIDGKNVMVVQDVDQMSRNSVQMDVQSIEPAAGTEGEIEIQEFQPRGIISDPGEAPSMQPDLSAIEMPVNEGVQIEMDSVDSTSATIKDKSTQTWAAKKGDSLKTVLHDWAKRSNTQVIWEASYDYRLEQDIDFQGSLEEAYNELLSSYNSSESKPAFRFVKQNKESSDTALIIVQDSEEAQPVTG